MRVKDKKRKDITNTISANIIFKVGDNIELSENVRYNRGTEISLITEELNYNIITKIATNTALFVGLYDANKIKGTNLYLDTINGIMQSKNTYFTIKSEEKDETN